MESLLKEHSIGEWAETLELAPRGFHAHRHKVRRPRRRQDAELRLLVERAFVQSRRTYGSPRLRMELRDWAIAAARIVARLMREAGLRAKQKRRFRPRTTDSRHGHKVAENWLSKVPAPQAPLQIWQSDISYLETQEGWLYFAFKCGGVFGWWDRFEAFGFERGDEALGQGVIAGVAAGNLKIYSPRTHTINKNANH